MGGETGAFRQSGKLEPSNAVMGIVKPHSRGRKSTIGASNDILTSDPFGKPHDAFGDQFRVLHQVRGVTDHTGDEDLPLGQPDLLEDQQFPSIASLSYVTMMLEHSANDLTSIWL